jgi:hypothetical protein
MKEDRGRGEREGRRRKERGWRICTILTNIANS